MYTDSPLLWFVVSSCFLGGWRSSCIFISRSFGCPHSDRFCCNGCLWENLHHLLPYSKLLCHDMWCCHGSVVMSRCEGKLRPVQNEQPCLATNFYTSVLMVVVCACHQHETTNTALSISQWADTHKPLPLSSSSNRLTHISLPTNAIHQSNVAIINPTTLLIKQIHLHSVVQSVYLPHKRAYPPADKIIVNIARWVLKYFILLFIFSVLKAFGNVDTQPFSCVDVFTASMPAGRRCFVSLW